ncbi:MAG: RidA family protein [Haloferacaceae archaeon]
MRRRSLRPTAGDDLSDSETAYAECVVEDHADHKRVHVSGLTSDEPHEAMGDQTRDVLEQIQTVVGEVGGDMGDVVRVRVYVEEPALTQANFEAIHAARREFFDPGSYPASTLVEVSKLIRQDRLIEIDADAVVPDDGWE